MVAKFGADSRAMYSLFAAAPTAISIGRRRRLGVNRFLAALYGLYPECRPTEDRFSRADGSTPSCTSHPEDQRRLRQPLAFQHVDRSLMELVNDLHKLEPGYGGVCA